MRYHAAHPPLRPSSRSVASWRRSSPSVAPEERHWSSSGDHLVSALLLLGSSFAYLARSRPPKPSVRPSQSELVSATPSGKQDNDESVRCCLQGGRSQHRGRRGTWPHVKGSPVTRPPCRCFSSPHGHHRRRDA